VHHSHASSSPVSLQNRNIHNNSRGFLQRWLEIVTLILRILLWPVRRAVQILLPAGDFDGLSPAVTEKAAQHFVTHLKSLASSPAQAGTIAEVFSTLGFAALKQEATTTNSLIVIYLHSPLHRQATEMCHRIIQPPMLQFLQQNHMLALGASVHTSQGAQLAQQLGAASFPLLALLQPASSANGGGGGANAGSFQLVFRIEGRVLLGMPIAQMLPFLVSTFQRHQNVMAEQEVRRLQREQEIELRQQQDAEYQEALAADQERERLQREEREREEQRVQEEQERESNKARDEAERLAKAKALLRPEPASGGTRIRFVLPSGQKLDRRFDNDDTVGALKAYLILHFAERAPEIKNISLSTNFPKQTYNEDDKSLQESGLSPQSVLMVQDLDA
jgi:FAS-associated factor 2